MTNEEVSRSENLRDKRSFKVFWIDGEERCVFVRTAMMMITGGVPPMLAILDENKQQVASFDVTEFRYEYIGMSVSSLQCLGHQIQATRVRYPI